ncbi:bifunctional UDP-N-acetylglucosamine diphosphorylase/glucosamine-1-phosphate N-acetyltransferase GlmU [Sulfurivirga sp.]|uniref:bifunctional UDP-N-acetylglucosamine diphosphorylase/glucosamine-1-phosphate N-acetyltransferase GlmU n=1 Tax=Sulfurivirga sp. TaxID=2614236 RepID=UPI0025FE5B79|nr:bifunctional UDP-N-acetylglucosamine diphosphorylase/glucosamine-1-phosphate N-acetyltransferase GlmU [Sulfurivirga sp.]
MLKAIVLAAGKGTRMKSRLPKVLQPLAGRPMLSYVLETAETVPVDETLVVVGHGAEQVRQAIKAAVTWIEQPEQHGTGHAVAQTLGHLADEDVALVLYGDVPLVRAETLRDLVRLVDDAHPLALLTVTLEDPTGYGRIVRDRHHQVVRIVEQKDATAEELAIHEVNTGMMAVRGAQLKRWIERLDSNNAQGEYYLTDIVGFCVADGFEIHTATTDDPLETLGVNDKLQLAALERAFQRRQVERLMREGVTVIDPARVDIRGVVTVGQDVTLDVGVILEGSVHLGDGVTVGAHSVLRNVVVEAGSEIRPFTHAEGVRIGEHCQVGPYARLRPGTELAEQVRVGNFVEIKNAQVAAGSKINHLAYVGDASVGREVNIGAGVITCNYDGANKHRTVIGDNAFIGSDTQLVAPVEVGAGATIGAGSTITKDAPAGELTLSRAKQVTVKGWQRPRKEK